MPTETNPPNRTNSDAILAHRVALCLAYQRDVDLHLVTVEADQGRVILSGTVTSRREHQRALMAARYVAGVVSVINQITVLSSPVERESVTFPSSVRHCHNESTAERFQLKP